MDAPTKHYAIAMLTADSGSGVGGRVLITQTEGEHIKFDFS